ncbi:MAG: class I SAM-dependent methyltransferase [Thermoplasmata archaeon]
MGNEKKAGHATTSEDLAERIAQEINGAMSAMTLYIGHRLGLFEALEETGPTTAPGLARRTGLSERYILEWLSALSAGGYLTYDPDSSDFSLPQAHREALLDAESPVYALPFVRFPVSIAAALPGVIEAFKTGGGVPYEAYGHEFVGAQGLQSRYTFLHELAEQWIGAMPDVRDRLAAGGRALEVGCGVGWAAIGLAHGFPAATIDAVDPDATSIRAARQNVESEGLSDRIDLHESIIEEAGLEGPYDLVAAFEVLHDLPYPVKGLKRMRELASPGGTVLIVDEAVEDSLEENANFMGHLFYNFSVLHCLPQSMTAPNSAGTGTVLTPTTLNHYAEKAGFSAVDVLPVEHPMFRLYRLTP